MDESGIWSILTDNLQYVKTETDILLTCSFDLKRHWNVNKYFDAALLGKSIDDNSSVEQAYNSKKENFDDANYNIPNVPVYNQTVFPQMVEDRYGDLTLFTSAHFKPHESICATYLWTEEDKCTIMESKAYDLKGNNMWFKQGRFPINFCGETQGELLDGTGIKLVTLMDTGCSKS